MSSKNVLLAYAIENTPLAEEIEKDLMLGGISVTHVYGSKSDNAPILSDQLGQKSGPVLLLITDNFLHSSSCMEGMLGFLQERRDDIMPIIAEGARKDEAGETVAVPTHFERISDIIQYINHWQDLYLDLRRQKREQTGKSEEKLQEQLRIVREISSEISEYLRQLRGLNYALFENLEAEDYLPVFRFLNLLPNWESFRMKRRSVNAAKTPSVQPAGHDDHEDTEDDDEEETPHTAPDDPEDFEFSGAFPEDKTPDLIQENPEEEPEEDQDDEDEAFDLIPDEPADFPEEETPLTDLETAHVNDPGAEDFPDEDPETPETEESGRDTEIEFEVNGESHPHPEPETTPEDVLEAAAQAGPEQAILILEQGLESWPNHPLIAYRLAAYRVKTDADHESARKVLNQLLEVHPTHVEGLFLRGELAEAAGEFGLAHEDYRKVAAMNPQFPDIFYRMGLLKAHFLGRSREALTDFQEAIRRQPSHVEAHYETGLILGEMLKDPGQAETYFKKTVALAPLHEFAHYDLALIYHQRGDRAAALDAYNTAARINPELKTPENDLAFAFDPNKAAGLQQDTISALKENLARLESLIQSQEEEAEKNKPALKGEGKLALITGVTSGIGHATAVAFAREGFRLILTGRRQERLEEIQQSLEAEFQAKVLTLCFDVRDYQAVSDAIAGLDAEWQNIDLLVNNAGKAKGLSPIHEGRLEHWEEMIDTNVKGLLYLTRVVTPQMVARRQGMVININSSAGKEVYPKGNVYCATKFAVDALTTAMRMDLHQHNIRVGQVSPGHVEDTEFALVRFDGDAERAAQTYEGFQPLKAEDVAEAILFMATRPPHVNIQDIELFGAQQASNLVIDRSGR